MGYSPSKRHTFTTRIIVGDSINKIHENHLPGIGIGTLYGWMKKLKSDGHLVPKKSPGRPEKFLPRTKRQRLCAAKLNPDMSIAQLTEAVGIDASHKTVVKLLKKDGIMSYVALKKPLLTERYIRIRYRWARDKIAYTMSDWKHWTFSDESMVDLDCSEGVQRFLITQSQRLEPQFIAGKKTMGGGKLMIWSFISWNGIGPLWFIEGGIDAKVYKGILKDSVLPHVEEMLYQNDAVQWYMDDGASSHDCDEVIEFCDAEGIQRLFGLPIVPT